MKAFISLLGSLSAALLCNSCFYSTSYSPTRTATVASASVSTSLNNIRNNAWDLTDRMAYELSLSNAQIEDVYQINMNFFYDIDDIMYYVTRGNVSYINRYNRYLYVRDVDLSNVLSYNQYLLYNRTRYFFEPVGWNQSNNYSWNISIAYVYSNYRVHKYYSRPGCYNSYRGDYRRGYEAPSHYMNRNYNNGHRAEPNRREVTYTPNYRKPRAENYHNDNSGSSNNYRPSEGNNHSNGNKPTQGGTNPSNRSNYNNGSNGSSSGSSYRTTNDSSTKLNNNSTTSSDNSSSRKSNGNSSSSGNSSYRRSNSTNNNSGTNSTTSQGGSSTKNSSSATRRSTVTGNTSSSSSSNNSSSTSSRSSSSGTSSGSSSSGRNR